MVMTGHHSVATVLGYFRSETSLSSASAKLLEQQYREINCFDPRPVAPPSPCVSGIEREGEGEGKGTENEARGPKSRLAPHHESEDFVTMVALRSASRDFHGE